MTDRIPLTRPTIGREELEAVAEVFASGWLAGQGPQCGALEEGFRALTEREHAIAVNNCTAGLHLVLAALDVGPGDEVIVADYTYPATAHAVLYCGATPRFVDVLPATGTVDTRCLPSLLTDRTRAVVAVDALGMPADWAELTAFAAAHDLRLVADAACSVGATYRSRPAGGFGDAAVFSLHARKGITSGEGGVVVTDSPEVAARVRSASCFGVAPALARSHPEKFQVPEFLTAGYNYKLSDVLAAIANVQVGRLPELLAARSHLAALYSRMLREVPAITPPGEPADRTSAWQTYAITLGRGLDRDAVAGQMRRAGIECTIGTFSLSRQPVYQTSDVCPTSWALADSQLALPFFPGLAERSQERVVEVLGRVVAEQFTDLA